MRFRPANPVKVNAVSISASVSDEFPNEWFDVRFQGGPVILHMPVDVEINLIEYMAGHGQFPLKPAKAG